MMEQVFQEVAFLIRGEKMVWQMVRNVCEGTSRNTSSMLADVERIDRRKLMRLLDMY